MPTIEQWLVQATAQLTHAQILTARLDAEIILAHALGASRTWLITHNNDTIDAVYTQKKADTLLEKRVRHCPIAYLTNSKEFYGRSFFVDESVLIPRPETEDLVELALKTLGTQGQSLHLVDVGTGSGCLGITLKLERPELDVTLCDISEPALAIAEKNAEKLGASVTCTESDLLYDLRSNIYDLVVANLPYVDASWQRSPETDYEPALALFADDHGLALIKKCMQQASESIAVGGHVVLEADPCQHDAIIAYGSQYGFTRHIIQGYCVSLCLESKNTPSQTR